MRATSLLADLWVLDYCKKVKKQNLYKTIVLPIVCEYQTWSLTCQDENKFRMFENRALRRILGPKRDVHNHGPTTYVAVVTCMKSRRQDV